MGAFMLQFWWALYAWSCRSNMEENKEKWKKNQKIKKLRGKKLNRSCKTMRVGDIPKKKNERERKGKKRKKENGSNFRLYRSCWSTIKKINWLNCFYDPHHCHCLVYEVEFLKVYMFYVRVACLLLYFFNLKRQLYTAVDTSPNIDCSTGD